MAVVIKMIILGAAIAVVWKFFFWAKKTMKEADIENLKNELKDLEEAEKTYKSIGSTIDNSHLEEVLEAQRKIKEKLKYKKALEEGEF